MSCQIHVYVYVVLIYKLKPTIEIERLHWHSHIPIYNTIVSTYMPRTCIQYKWILRFKHTYIPFQYPEIWRLNPPQDVWRSHLSWNPAVEWSIGGGKRRPQVITHSPMVPYTFCVQNLFKTTGHNFIAPFIAKFCANRRLVYSPTQWDSRVAAGALCWLRDYCALPDSTSHKM